MTDFNSLKPGEDRVIVSAVGFDGVQATFKRVNPPLVKGDPREGPTIVVQIGNEDYGFRPSQVKLPGQRP